MKQCAVKGSSNCRHYRCSRHTGDFPSPSKLPVDLHQEGSKGQPESTENSRTSCGPLRAGNPRKEEYNWGRMWTCWPESAGWGQGWGKGVKVPIYLEQCSLGPEAWRGEWWVALGKVEGTSRVSKPYRHSPVSWMIKAQFQKGQVKVHEKHFRDFQVSV